jgi:flagellar protein FlaG
MQTEPAAASAAAALSPPPVARPEPARASAPVAPAAAVATPRAPEAPKKAALAVNPEQTRRDLQEAVARLNEMAQRNGRNLAFAIDEAVDRTVITVKNRESGEVVRQIPDETVLRVAHHLEAVKGLLADDTV